MKQLYFCRHGESVLNSQHLYAGRINTPLTIHGQQQAALAGAHAKSLGIDLILASPLARTQETAKIIAEAINYPIDKIVTVDRLVERSLGTLEGKSWDEFNEDDPSFTDVESYEDLQVRTKEVLLYLLSLEAETALVVGHGAFALALRAAIDPSQVYPELANAEIIQLI